MRSIVLTLLFVPFLALAAPSQEAPVPWLKKADSKGCFLTLTAQDQTSVTISTFHWVIGTYDEPLLPHEALLHLVRDALSAGCPTDVMFGDMGLSPLNHAVLWNYPDLVSVLLKGGANPDLLIAGNRPSVNGMNSYQFLAWLKRRPLKDRSEVERLLDIHRVGQ